jgi:hypothetical protein
LLQIIVQIRPDLSAASGGSGRQLEATMLEVSQREIAGMDAFAFPYWK